MAFKVRKLNHRPWPVTVKLQEGDAAGNVVETAQTFVVHVRPFTEAEHADMMVALDAAWPLPEGRDRLDLKSILVRNADYFARLVVGWGPEVTDEAGLPLPYSSEALTALVTGPDGLALSAALNQAVNELRFGIAPAKNSATSPMPGEDSSAGEVATSLPTT